MNRIQELRKNKGYTLQKLSKILNIAPSTLSQYESEKREASYDTIKKLAQEFDVSIDFLLCQETQDKKNILKIPVYGTIPAGIPTEMIDTSYIEDYEEINEDLIKSGNTYFGLKVKGDSMFPEFRNGDTLILKKQSSCNNGDFCAISIKPFLLKARIKACTLADIVTVFPRLTKSNLS